MRIVKRTLSLCLVLFLAIVIFPNTAITAASEHWADDSVDKLNALYGPETFSMLYDQTVTVGDLKDLLVQTFKYSDADGFIGVAGVDDAAAVTRGVLAHTLAKLFDLGKITGTDDASKIDSAIGICKAKGVMSGYSEEEFGKNNPVNKGELAVAFSRAVNKAAGSVKANKWGLKPGIYGYEELLYFLVRGIPYGADVYNSTFDEDVAIDVAEGGGTNTYTGAENVWNKWNEMLNNLGHAEINTGYGDSGLSAVSSTVCAVAQAVKLYRIELEAANDNTDIFYDVPVTSWFYDGIMYLLNEKIIAGYGNGNFGPYDSITRAQMATIILRLSGVDTNSLPTPDKAEFTSVFTNPDFLDNNGNLKWTANIVWAARDYYGSQRDFDPDSFLTREEMAFAAVSLYDGYNADDVNLAILDRFADKNDIGDEFKKPLAYLVSIGVLSGSPGAGGIYLYPQNTCNRAEAGVFVARVLQGLDKSKMKDYENAVDYVKNEGGGQ